mgnify:FL=1
MLSMWYAIYELQLNIVVRVLGFEYDFMLLAFGPEILKLINAIISRQKNWMVYVRVFLSLKQVVFSILTLCQARKWLKIVLDLRLF